MAVLGCHSRINPAIDEELSVTRGRTLKSPMNSSQFQRTGMCFCVLRIYGFVGCTSGAFVSYFVPAVSVLKSRRNEKQ